MVYVTRDGTIHNEQPWGFQKIMGIFSGIAHMIFAFFQTMLPIESSTANNNFRNSGGGSWRSGGGGGGSGGYPKPGSGRPGGNVRGLGSLPPGPPPACGSCCGR